MYAWGFFMNFDYMEDMAREYKYALKASSFGLDSALDNTISLVEKQLSLITAALFCTRPLNNALSYLESIKRQTLTELYMLRHNEIPCFSATKQNVRSLNPLIDAQIELLISLDKCAQKGFDISGILKREERSLSLIALIRCN